MMISWEAKAREEEELYTILVLGLGLGLGMMLLVGGRMETIGLLDDSLHLGLFIMRVAMTDM